MKTGFKNSIAIKNPKNIRNPWSFECPPYDQRSSCFINAGTNYGVGHKTPVGKDNGSPYAVPSGHPAKMKTDEIYHKSPGLIQHAMDE